VPGHGRPRPPLNSKQQNWKACWGNPQEFESLILRQGSDQAKVQSCGDCTATWRLSWSQRRSHGRQDPGLAHGLCRILLGGADFRSNPRGSCCSASDAGSGRMFVGELGEQALTEGGRAVYLEIRSNVSAGHGRAGPSGSPGDGAYRADDEVLMQIANRARSYPGIAWQVIRAELQVESRRGYR
jgi:hypothetical protein